MKIALDRDVCRGNAACVVAAPDLFDYEDMTGKAYLLGEDVPGALADSARMAVLHCPTQAVSLAED